MPRWMKPTEEHPDDLGIECGDRILVIINERNHAHAPLSPRLVILEATEDGWDSSDPVYRGYGPNDGVLWAWEKDVCAIAHALGGLHALP